MDNLQFRKFEKKDFGTYFQLVSNEMVMAQITERAIPLDEAKINYQRIIDRNAEADMFGTYKIVENETFVGLGHLTRKTGGEAEIGYMILPEYWGIRNCDCRSFNPVSHFNKYSDSESNH